MENTKEGYDIDYIRFFSGILKNYIAKNDV